MWAFHLTALFAFSNSLISFWCRSKIQNVASVFTLHIDSWKTQCISFAFVFRIKMKFDHFHYRFESICNLFKQIFYMNATFKWMENKCSEEHLDGWQPRSLTRLKGKCKCDESLSLYASFGCAAHHLHKWTKAKLSVERRIVEWNAKKTSMSWSERDEVVFDCIYFR